MALRCCPVSPGCHPICPICRRTGNDSRSFPERGSHPCCLWGCHPPALVSEPNAAGRTIRGLGCFRVVPKVPNVELEYHDAKAGGHDSRNFLEQPKSGVSHSSMLPGQRFSEFREGKVLNAARCPAPSFFGTDASAASQSMPSITRSPVRLNARRRHDLPALT